MGDGSTRSVANHLLKLAAGNGVKKMYVGQNGYLATPAASLKGGHQTLKSVRRVHHVGVAQPEDPEEG